MQRVGVLALQGGYAAHLILFAKSDSMPAKCETLKTSTHSTASFSLAEEHHPPQAHPPLRPGIKSARIRSLRPSGVRYVCGHDLSAKRVTHPEQASFGWLDIDVREMGGVASSTGLTFADGTDLPLCFIRAPRITRVGPV